MTATSPRPLDLRLDVLGLVVDDMAATLAFYRLLGLDLPPEADAEPHVEVTVGGLRVAFDTVEVIRSFAPDHAEDLGTGRVGLAFLAPSPEAVDAAYDVVTGAGYTGALPPFDAFWGQRYATVLDPNGVSVDLFAALPQAPA